MEPLALFNIYLIIASFLVYYVYWIEVQWIKRDTFYN